MHEWITLTREEIYDLVWQKPMARLAAEHSISDVGLANLCARHDIPTPPRGYWARRDAGSAPPKPALPESPHRSPIRLRAAQPSEGRSDKHDELSAAIALERKPENRIEVADRLQAPAPLVRQAKDALASAKEDTVGLLVPPTDGLDIRVSRAVLSRALRVADALLKAFEARSWTVAVVEGKTLVRIGTAAVAITIEEPIVTIEVPVKPDLNRSHSFHYNRRDTVRKPCGDLSVSIREQRHLWNHNQQRNWRGSEKRVLEARLNDVLVGMLKLAAAVSNDLQRRKQEELTEQERARKLQAALDEQDRLRGALAREKANVERLLRQSARWRQSEQLRRFIQQVRDRGAPPELALDGQELMEWVQWALEQADRLDPFAASPPSILDRADRIEHMCDDLQRRR